LKTPWSLDEEQSPAELLRQVVCWTEKINPNHIPDPQFLI